MQLFTLHVSIWAEVRVALGGHKTPQAMGRRSGTSDAGTFYRILNWNAKIISKYFKKGFIKVTFANPETESINWGPNSAVVSIYLKEILFDKL